MNHFLNDALRCGLAAALAAACLSVPAADFGPPRPAAPPRKASAPPQAAKRAETAKPTAPAAAPAGAGASAKGGTAVEADRIHLAAVITPGIDEARRTAWLETLRALVGQHNNNSNTVNRPSGRSAPQAAWQLHVWELSGPSSGWAAQLETQWKKQPVLALASGLGTLWQPVDAFCQQHKVPCWFPSVDAMPATTGSHALYFQAGVRLEAAVLARHLRELPPARRPARLVQFYRNDALGAAAAQALKDALAGSEMAVEYRALSTQQPEALDAALAAEPAGAAWMLWLRGADLERLAALPQPAGHVFFSGRLAGSLAAVPAPWRERAAVVYPYAMDRKGAPAAEEFERWAQSRELALVDAAMQAETFYSLQILGEALAEASPTTLTPDWLLARGRALLSPGTARRVSALFGAPAPTEAASAVALREHTAVGRAANLRMLQALATESREATTLYPQLIVEPGQSIASRGAYIVGFDAASRAPVARTAWIVPSARP